MNKKLAEKNISPSPSVAPARAAQPIGKKDPKVWLKQFTPVNEVALGERQRAFVNSLRRLYPNGLVGNRRGTDDLCFYAADPAVGVFSGLVPQEEL